MIVIHAFIKVQSAHRDRFLELADDAMKGSKAEEGNISYHLYEDTKEENTFVMVEEWKDLAAVKFHGKTEHYISFKEKSKDILAAPTQVEVYEAGKL